ncbi:MAG: WD40 repeat domain-containing protein [Verrucomicrobiota bacterium]
MKYLFFFSFPAVLLMALPAVAAHPERVIVDTYEEFQEGTSKSVSLSEEGFLRRAPELKEVSQVSAGQAWDMLEGPDGSFLLATSPDGELRQVNSNGEEKLVTKFAEKQVTALARDSQGRLFAATSPDGKVYRLPPDGKPEVWFNPKEKYIWDLKFDGLDALYVATGTEGKVYRVTGQGRGKVYYDSDETHIFTLAMKPGSSDVLAGSGDNGYLYQITGQDQAVVLFSNGEKQVNNIVVDSDGVIYFTALGGKGGSKPSASRAARLSSLRQMLSAARSGQGGNANEAKDDGDDKGGAQSKNGGGEASKLYRLDQSLYAEQIWSNEATVYDMKMRDGKLYLGTGDEGYFYEVTTDGEATLLLQVDGQTISALLPIDGGRFALATSNPVKLFLTGRPESGGGVYESMVFDSESFAKWGAVTAKTEGRVKIRTRSGNTPDPDKSWYEWLDLGSQSQPRSKPARFFQVELTVLQGVLDRFELVYLPRNLPPRIQEVLVLPPGVGFQSIVPPPQPLTPRTIGQLLRIDEDEDPDNLRRAFEVRFQPELKQGLRTAVWQVEDPNRDELRYNVYYREDTGDEWHLLVDELREPVVSWDSTGWPDGSYYLKVEASDAEDNAPEDQMQHAKVSKLLTIDNTPPKITVDSTSGGELRFRVSDDASMLLSIQVSRNGYDFKPLRPEDGILDGQNERFVTKIEPGEVIFIRAEDEGGNVSSAQARGK